MDLYIPFPWEILLRINVSPDPAQTMLTSDGATASDPMDETGWLSKMGLQAEPPSEEKFKTLAELLRRSPAFPAAWSELANSLQDPGERMQAIEQGLAHDPDSQMRETLLLGKAILLSQQGQQSQAIEILEALVGDPDSTLGNLAVAQVVLAGLRAGK